jgi:hypothetical protein
MAHVAQRTVKSRLWATDIGRLPPDAVGRTRPVSARRMHSSAVRIRNRKLPFSAASWHWPVLAITAEVTGAL